MRPSFLSRFFVAILLTLLATAPVFGQTSDPPVGVAVKIWAKGTATADGASLTIWGDFLESSPGAADGSATITANGDTGATLTAVLGSLGYVRVLPAKTYKIYSSSSSYVGGSVNIVAPPGYRVVMDNMLRTAESNDGNTAVVFQLLPLAAQHPGLAGMASSISSLEIDWRVSLGSLLNGGSAGDLELIDTGQRTDWTPIFTPASLYYQEISSEVSVYRPSNIIRQIVANQVVVDVVPLPASNPTYYEIRCFHPAQAQNTTFPRTFTGSPYVTYRVEQGATATALKITKEVRNVADALTIFPIARSEVLSLARTGTWPTVTWTKNDWTLLGAAPLAETYVASSGTTASRSESIAVRVPGSNTAVTSVTRNYSVPTVNSQSVIGEVLASETAGSTDGLTATFDYYSDTSQFGSLGYLKSATLPGGSWVAYSYYTGDPSSGQPTGRVQTRYRPYLNSPATVTQSTTQGEVTSYQYVNDIFGAPTRPSLVQTKVNDTLTAQTATTYNDVYAIANGYIVAQSTRTESANATSSLQTLVRYYREDAGDAFIRGQIFSITAPDGVKRSFAYQRGTWSGTAFAPGTGSIGTGSASRVSVITGSTNSSAGSACPTLDSYTVDTVYLVDGKSTKEVTIRDGRGLVVRAESHIWKTSAWQQVSYTIYNYDFGGRLTSRTASNGATYTATYDGGLKTGETDEAGVTTTYIYDVAGRVSVSTRAGSGAIGALATKLTYDAASQITKEEVGFGQTGVITTNRTFDDAGRPTALAPPGNYGAEAYTYDVANRAQTTTRADGSTVVTTAYRDGQRYSVTGTGVVPAYHTYGVETTTALSGQRWHQVNSGTATSPRYQKSWADWVGRSVKTQQPGFSGQQDVVAESFYESGTGHLIKTTKTGYAPTLYQYNILGQVFRSGLDYDNGGALVLASNDRITDTDTYLESYNNAWWMRTETKSYPNLGLNTVVFTSVARTRLTGHPANRLLETQSIDVEGNVTTQTVDVNRSAKTSTATTTRSGVAGSVVESTLNGFSTSVTSFDGLTVTKAYDSLLRPSAVTDSRGNTTTSAYIAGTLLVSSVTDAANGTAVTTYDGVGRVSTTRDPKNFYTRNAYNTRGQLLRQWGDGATPVEYGYDSTYGDRTSLSTFRGGTGWDSTTWSSDPGTADTVTSTYDGPSGLLTTKTHPAADPTSSDPALNQPMSVTQTYNLRGQTATRTLARSVTTTYGYDNATGELLSQTYSDNTPAVTFAYTRSGQVDSVSDFTGTRDLVYDAAKPWRLTAEAESAFYGSRVLTRMYENNPNSVVGRVTGIQLGAAAGDNTDLEQTFGFTTVGRFSTIASNRNANTAARTFRYGYLANSALLSSVSVDGAHPFTITRTYEDHRDLITSIDSKWSTTSRARYAYTYDERGQRATAVQSGDVFSDYGDSLHRIFAYDGHGELTADIAYLNSTPTDQSAPLPGRRYEYAYDNAGNRTTSNRTGISSLVEHYATNTLNQYVTRENVTVPLSGTAAPDAGGAGGNAVSVQGGTLSPVAASRQGRYWNSEITVNNNANPNAPNPWRGPLTIFTAKRGTSGSPDVYRADSRMAEIGAFLQKFTHDADGNLTSDGICDYQWDAENRLVRMETTTMAQSWNFPHRIIEFRYDYMGRRVQKRVLDADQSPALEISSRRYLYDGWNLVAEYAAPGGSSLGALLRSYTWGLDIALSVSNAGGVGALLQIADHPSGKTYLPAYDGNGNIIALLNGDSGAAAAIYEYSPFGEPLRAQTNDPTIADNPFRFSTKFTDLETGLVCYGHRYYDPKNGRFINRDPIEEAGGVNLYSFCRNNPTNSWDYLGMDEVDEVAPESASDVGYHIAVCYLGWTEDPPKATSTGSPAVTTTTGVTAVNATGKNGNAPTSVVTTIIVNGFGGAADLIQEEINEAESELDGTISEANSYAGMGPVPIDLVNKIDFLNSKLSFLYTKLGMVTAGIDDGDGEIDLSSIGIGLILISNKKPAPPTGMPFGIVYANQPAIGKVDSLAHSFLIITPTNQAAYATNPYFQNIDSNGNRYATLGAGPDSSLYIFGNLISGVDRKEDVIGPRNSRISLAVPSIYLSEDEAIAVLIQLTLHYNNNQVLYDALPVSGAKGWNSNSFISGLLLTAGFQLPSPSNAVPGWGKPVPTANFLFPPK